MRPYDDEHDDELDRRSIRRRRVEDEEDDDDMPSRETLMQRRLRRARGEHVDDDDDDAVVMYERPRYQPHTYPYTGGRGGGGAAAAILYLTLGAMTVTLLVLIFGQQMLAGFNQSVPEQLRVVIATPSPTIRDRGGAIRQMQSLNRLETQSFSIERIVEARIERGNVLDVFLGDRLLLIASGEVIAGVDMSKLQASDVEFSSDGEQITVRLPPTEIFSARLDNERTRVYDRQQGFFADSNKDLETQARQEAEREILRAACENQIMQKAADDAQRSLEQLLALLDFRSVTVIATAGSCVASATAQP
ncbi:MAG TPA: DUF4230 domain-containing protein [Roseiflexaceae bacterium]|nr:DUF4230 domain-containing protein [Roseiflexaceae bacterium]